MRSDFDIQYTPEERAACIAKMKAASSSFYAAAVRCGNHAFIEFTGLMNEYIKLCEDAERQGIDFMHANVHGGTHLPFQPHHISYLNEKLECIYGVRFSLETSSKPVDQLADICPICESGKIALQTSCGHWIKRRTP